MAPPPAVVLDAFIVNGETLAYRTVRSNSIRAEAILSIFGFAIDGDSVPAGSTPRRCAEV